MLKLSLSVRQNDRNILVSCKQVCETGHEWDLCRLTDPVTQNPACCDAGAIRASAPLTSAASFGCRRRKLRCSPSYSPQVRQPVCQ